MRTDRLRLGTLLSVLGLAGCAHSAWHVPAPEERGPMPVCAAPPVAPAEWKATTTPDSSVTFRVPPSYRPRNAYGSWTTQNRLPQRPGDRDFSLVLSARGGSLREMEGDPRMDGYELEHWTSCEVVAAGRTFRVETAWMRGGLGGWPWGRHISVEQRLATGQAIFLEGEAGDEPGLRELLAIALTAEPRGQR